MTAGGRVERSALSRIVLRGADRRDFLDRMATNDLRALAPGQGAPTFFLERSGRTVDRVVVLERGEDAMLIGSAGRAGALVAWLSRHVIADDVRIEDVGAETSLVTALGEDAPRVIEASLGVAAAALAPWEHRPAPALAEATVVRAEDVGGRSFHVVAPRGARPAVDEALADLAPLADDVYRALRIAAGVPAFGEDFGDRTIPLETRQLDHFSFAKGCYVGQEVIARLSRGDRVKRALVRMRVEGADAPEAGATLADGDAEVGVVTSAAAADGVVLALGYVEAGRATPGRRLALREGAARRGVEILPLAPAGNAP